MRRSVDIILHPPELNGKERWRYWLSVTAWLILMLVSISLLNGLTYFGLWALIKAYGEGAVSAYEVIILIIGILNVIIGVVVGDRIWSRLFIQSGYLPDSATIRILSNRAPTQTSERRHRWLGQAILLLVYGGMGVAAAMAKQWWALIVVIPLGVWGVFLMRNAWKESDAMLKGGAIPPASEERIRYIEKVLDDRSQNK